VGSTGTRCLAARSAALSLHHGTPNPAHRLGTSGLFSAGRGCPPPGCLLSFRSTPTHCAAHRAHAGRAIRLARLANVPLYVVHVMSIDAMEQVRAACLEPTAHGCQAPCTACKHRPFAHHTTSSHPLSLQAAASTPQLVHRAPAGGSRPPSGAARGGRAGGLGPRPVRGLHVEPQLHARGRVRDESAHQGRRPRARAARRAGVGHAAAGGHRPRGVQQHPESCGQAGFQVRRRPGGGGLQRRAEHRTMGGPVGWDGIAPVCPVHAWAGAMPHAQCPTPLAQGDPHTQRPFFTDVSYPLPLAQDHTQWRQWHRGADACGVARNGQFRQGCCS
jgi:hypothetical protein